MTSADPRLSRVSAIAAATAVAALAGAPAVAAAPYLKIHEGAGTAAAAAPVGKVFIADSFSFGVEREMKESGEKGGTADINIGVGELQEVTISKPMESASPPAPKDRPMTWDNVKQKGWTGSAREHDKRTVWVARSAPAQSGAVRVKVKMPWLACRVGARYPLIELVDGTRVYRLRDAVVTRCSGDADDRPTEEVAFYYNKLG